MDRSKICTKCGKEKFINAFTKDKNRKDDLDRWCKECKQKYKKIYYKNNKEKVNKKIKIYRKSVPWKCCFQNILKRCNNINNKSYKNYGNRGIKCLITEEELKELWFRDKAYNMKKPSIDRIENDGNYKFSNCRYIEFSNNIIKRNKEYCSKIILQYDLNKKFIKEWKSLTEASKKLKTSKGFISSCALGKIKIAKGFIWKYKEDVND